MEVDLGEVNSCGGRAGVHGALDGCTGIHGVIDERRGVHRAMDGCAGVHGRWMDVQVYMGDVWLRK